MAIEAIEWFDETREQTEEEPNTRLALLKLVWAWGRIWIGLMYFVIGGGAFRLTTTALSNAIAVISVCALWTLLWFPLAYRLRQLLRAIATDWEAQIILREAAVIEGKRLALEAQSRLEHSAEDQRYADEMRELRRVARERMADRALRRSLESLNRKMTSPKDA